MAIAKPVLNVDVLNYDTLQTDEINKTTEIKNVASDFNFDATYVNSVFANRVGSVVQVNIEFKPIARGWIPTNVVTTSKQRPLRPSTGGIVISTSSDFGKVATLTLSDNGVLGGSFGANFVGAFTFTTTYITKD